MAALETSPTEPPPIALLDAPLDYIFADHLRQRSICAALRSYAERQSATRAEVDRVVAFLKRELALHHADEDCDLYPALLRRALPADDLEAVIARLSEDHRQSAVIVQAILRMLEAEPDADPVCFDPTAGALMQAFAAQEHRHLAVENGVVLAIARIRLTRGDIKAISSSMKARRGITVP